MKNLIIYNCCPVNENELSFWNALNDAKGLDSSWWFFTVFPNQSLTFENMINLVYDQQVYIDLPGIPEAWRGLVDTIAQYDHVWERYDGTRSQKKAWGWLIYWLNSIHLLKAAAVYVWNGHDIIGRSLLEAAKLTGIDSFFMERGPLARTFVCDPKGVNFVSSFVSNYQTLNEGSSENVDKFVANYFATGVSNWKQPEITNEIDQFKTLHGIPYDKVVLFIPEQIDKDVNCKLYSPVYETFGDALLAVAVEVAPLGDSVFIVGKSHPMSIVSDDRYHDALRGIGAWLEDAHIFDCIKVADGIISVNSSSAVEGALFGKPVLLLGQSILSPSKNVVNVSSRESLKSNLNNFIAPLGGGRRKIDAEYFGKLLFDYLYTVDAEKRALGMKGVEQFAVPRNSHAKAPANSIEHGDLIKTFLTMQLNDYWTHHKFEEKSSVEIAELKGEVKMLRNSLSWRITTPLRLLRKLLGI